MVFLWVRWGFDLGYSEYHRRWWLHVGPVLVLV